ncbi:universal stress protein [Streptomyces meridianus]|uniref:Universal stress protein n=1 Tax=Streptomyces meridianus TaxID=2938945 RepID=A0ABT0X4S7_9ACTN|nr:universal stress protein [Streptomyces meridianus]MCM2577424.1 universal stress protein [Streptomyces meridianus]
MEPVITAGLDGSSESLAAARWAAGEAQLRTRPLRLMHAWILLAPPGPEGTADSDQNYWSRRIVDDAEQVVHEQFPGLPVVKDLVADDPGEALVAAAEQSEMLVLGSRGLEALTSYFLGDTGLHVMTRAERPVVLVRTGEPSPAAGKVALAMNLHGSCDELIDFAFDTAARRGAGLRVVHGLHRHPHIHAPWGRSADAEQEMTNEKLHEMRDALRPWREKYPSVPVEESVRAQGGAARAVVQAAGDSSLLVIGRRRHPHRTIRPHLGPVLQAAVHHAPCPVAVVPHD